MGRSLFDACIQRVAYRRTARILFCSAMSQELILHHYAMSPFAEKIRLAMGVKSLKWRSVLVEQAPPRPLLDALTGGYRRVPVLQVGADIYCDTHLILRAIDRLQPGTPSMFANSAVQPLCWWWDKTTFMPVIRLWARLYADNLPQTFLDDRKSFTGGPSLSKADNEGDIALNAQRIKAHLAWINDMLADAKPFLLGSTSPSALDLTVYHTLWFAKNNGGPEMAALLSQLFQAGPLLSWFESVASLGHGTREEMTPEQAFEVAQNSEPVEPTYIRSDSNTEWPIGQRLRITPDDMGRVPVEGTLVAVDQHEIVLRLPENKAGNINVHFPRAGFDVVPL